MIVQPHSRRLKNISLDIKDSEFMVLVGRSGGGKSITLRMVAGLENNHERDNLNQRDRVAHDLEPKDRGISMVFQSQAL